MSERDSSCAPVAIKGQIFQGYSVTASGIVLSHWTESRGDNGRFSWIIGDVSTALMPWLVNGYPTVALRRNGRTTNTAVHRLVAEAFIGPCPAGQEVCHNDGTRTNCDAGNLRYDTRKNNLADREQHGTAQRGERNPAATLTDAQADEIKTLRKQGVPLRILAAQFAVAESTISRIANGVRRA